MFVCFFYHLSPTLSGFVINCGEALPSECFIIKHGLVFNNLVYEKYADLFEVICHHLPVCHIGHQWIKWFN